jgi:hypothetical protein
MQDKNRRKKVRLVLRQTKLIMPIFQMVLRDIFFATRVPTGRAEYNGNIRNNLSFMQSLLINYEFEFCT